MIEKLLLMCLFVSPENGILAILKDYKDKANKLPKADKHHVLSR